jgi:hypothetical protein
VSFTFTHDGHTYRLDTEGGEVHCHEPDAREQREVDLEPSDEGNDG